MLMFQFAITVMRVGPAAGQGFAGQKYQICLPEIFRILLLFTFLVSTKDLIAIQVHQVYQIQDLYHMTVASLF